MSTTAYKVSKILADNPQAIAELVIIGMGGVRHGHLSIYTFPDASMITISGTEYVGGY